VTVGAARARRKATIMADRPAGNKPQQDVENTSPPRPCCAGAVLRKTLSILRRLFTFRLGTVVIYRHVELRSLTCPAEVRPVNEESIEDALAMDDAGRVENLRRAVGRGERAYFAYSGGKVVHRSLVQSGPGKAICELRVSFDLAEGEGYVHHSKTAPAMRGRGIYPAVLSRIAQDWRQRGRRLFIATVEANEASMRGIEKAGFKLARRVASLVWFGRCILQKDLKVKQ